MDWCSIVDRLIELWRLLIGAIDYVILGVEG